MAQIPISPISIHVVSFLPHLGAYLGYLPVPGPGGAGDIEQLRHLSLVNGSVLQHFVKIHIPPRGVVILNNFIIALFEGFVHKRVHNDRGIDGPDAFLHFVLFYSSPEMILY